MVVALRCCIANLRVEVPGGSPRVAGRQAGVNNDCSSWLCSGNI